MKIFNIFSEKNIEITDFDNGNNIVISTLSLDGWVVTLAAGYSEGLDGTETFSVYQMNKADVNTATDISLS